MDKKGGITDIFLVLILIFVIGVSSIAFMFVAHTLNTEITDNIDSLQNAVSDNTNVSEIVANTIGKTDSAIQNLKWIGVMLFIGLILASIISNLFVTAHPVFFPVYFFIGIIGVVMSVVLSNSWEEIINNATLESTALGMGGINFFIANLPVIMTVTFFLGAIVLFINWRKGSELL